MHSREPELYKDKIEVSLDGRQIFYLFFGGAVIVGLVFVLGVMVGRRVEARGHFDRADTQAANDPLAALDRLERSDKLSFHGALTGAEATTDVERAIGELDKRRAAGKVDARAGKVEGKVDKVEGKVDKVESKVDKVESKVDKVESKVDKVESKADKPDDKPGARADKPDVKLDKPDVKLDKPDVKLARADKPEARAAKADGKPDKPEARSEGKSEARSEGKSEARSEPVTRPDADRPKHDGDKKAKKHDDGATGEARADTKPDRPDARRSDVRADKPVTRSDARAEDAKPVEAKVRFTLQLSSFQDRSEAEAFLTATRSAGYQPYLTEAEVSGKGTFYRVRLGSYRSLEAANDAKADYEKAAKKSAQIMRL